MMLLTHQLPGPRCEIAEPVPGAECGSNLIKKDYMIQAPFAKKFFTKGHLTGS